MFSILYFPVQYAVHSSALLRAPSCVTSHGRVTQPRARIDAEDCKLNRSRDRQLLRGVCESEVVCESVFGLMDLNGDGQLDATQLKDAVADKRFESAAKTAFITRQA